MAIEDGEDLAAREARVEHLLSRWEALNRANAITAAAAPAAGQILNNASVTFTGGGLMAVMVAIVGLGSIGFGLHMSAMSDIKHQASMDVLAAERRADMRDLSNLKRTVGDLSSWRQVHADRLNALEAQVNGKPDPERR